MKCIIQSWQHHQAELYHWLLSRLANRDDADDVLQMVFAKAISQGENFCAVENTRAWLFRVTRNILIDRYRLKRNIVALPEDLESVEDESEAIDQLTECVPRVLSELSAEDREAITLCDLDCISQQDYAQIKNISLSAAKSRIQRARKRMRQQLEVACQVKWDESGNVCCFVPRERLM